MNCLSNGVGKNFQVSILYIFTFTLLTHFAAIAAPYDKYLRILHQKTGSHVYSEEDQISFSLQYGDRKKHLLSREVFTHVLLPECESKSLILLYRSPRPLLFLLYYSLTNEFSIDGLNLEKDFKIHEVLLSIFYVYEIAPTWFANWQEDEQQQMIEAYYVFFKDLLERKITTMVNISLTNPATQIGDDNWKNLFNKLNLVSQEVSEKNKLERHEEALRAEDEKAAKKLLRGLKYKSINRKLKKGINSYLIIRCSTKERKKSVYQHAVARHNRNTQRSFNLKTDAIEEERHQKYASSSEKASILSYESLVTKYRLLALPRQY
jgi:hypothetical protein